MKNEGDDTVYENVVRTDALVHMVLQIGGAASVSVERFLSSRGSNQPDRPRRQYWIEVLDFGTP